MEFDVREIKMSSIRLSKFRGLVETSWLVNLNNARLVVVSLLLEIE